MEGIKGRLAQFVAWAGPVLLALGLVTSPVLRQMPHGRFGELVLIALVALGIAAASRRLRGWGIAEGVAGFFLLALMLFAGIAPFVAAMVMALAAAAIGGTLAPRQPVSLQIITGSLLLAGTLGWLLQLPLHHRWVLLPILVGVIVLRRHALRDVLCRTRVQWREAVGSAPKLSVFAVLLLGLASTGSWIPTLQYDDLAYHLRLPWQLMEQAAYLPAADQQIWALAPWASDILHAVPQVIAGSEARGPVNALWLVLIATGVYRFAAALGAAAPARWLAVALAASLPLTAGLATSMQTELLTAAGLAWLAALVAGPREAGLRFWLLVAALAGGLAAVKLTAGAMAAVLVLWALCRHRWPSLPGIALVVLVAALAGGASYAQAAWLTGNPVLPLFNGVFQSPVMAPANFSDPRWQAGFGSGFDLLWRMTFDSPRYVESHHGAAGFVLVACAGLWLLALLQARTRTAALACTAVLVLPLLPVQYLRYAYPGIVLMCAVVAAAAPDRRSLQVLLIATCILDVGFMANGNWMLRSGAVKDTVRHLGDTAPLMARFAPERSLIAAMRTAGATGGNVLLLDRTDAFAAELGGRGRTVGWYAPRLEAAATRADADPSGRTWHALLQAEGICHVIVRADTLTPAQAAALQQTGALLRLTVGGRAWWSLPACDASAGH